MVVDGGAQGDERPQPWHWQFFGACRDADASLFFHPPGERGSTRRRRDYAAKAICATCPVLLLCRKQSLQLREPFGVWGGLTEAEREAWLAKRDARECAAVHHAM